MDAWKENSISPERAARRNKIFECKENFVQLLVQIGFAV